MGVRRELVYDPVLRLIHAWNLVTTLTLVVTGLTRQWLEPGLLSSTVRDWHISAGNALALGLVARMAWGLVGPSHARLSELWRPGCWIATINARRIFSAPQQFGHHAPATAAYLSVYGMLTGLTLTGFALTAIKLGNGLFSPMLAYALAWKTPALSIHEILAYGVIVFIILHIVAMVVHHIRHGLPVAQSMVTGYQYLKEE